jgi:hypothetical protein
LKGRETVEDKETHHEGCHDNTRTSEEKTLREATFEMMPE